RIRQHRQQQHPGRQQVTHRRAAVADPFGGLARHRAGGPPLTDDRHQSPKALFISAAAALVASSTLCSPVAICWIAVGRMPCASIFVHAGVAGTNFVPALTEATNGSSDLSEATSFDWTSPNVGSVPIASYIFCWYFLPASSLANSTASPYFLLARKTPMRLPPANGGAIEPVSVPGSGTTLYLPFTAPASIAGRLKSPPMTMPAFPAANAATASLPVICAHADGGQMSSEISSA